MERSEFEINLTASFRRIRSISVFSVVPSTRFDLISRVRLETPTSAAKSAIVWRSEMSLLTIASAFDRKGSGISVSSVDCRVMTLGNARSTNGSTFLFCICASSNWAQSCPAFCPSRDMEDSDGDDDSHKTSSLSVPRTDIVPGTDMFASMQSPMIWSARISHDA